MTPRCLASDIERMDLPSTEMGKVMVSTGLGWGENCSSVSDILSFSCLLIIQAEISSRQLKISIWSSGKRAEMGI